MTATTSPDTATTVVSVPRSEIARALRAASSIKAKAVYLDLSGERVTVNAYTAETAVRVKLDAAGNKSAACLPVPRVMLAGVLPYMAADVRLSFADDHLVAVSGESEFKIRTLRAAPSAAPAESVTSRRRGRRRFAASEAPYADPYGHSLDLAGETVSESVSFEAPTLIEILRRGLLFAGTDMTRPVLCNIAIYPSANVAAATDSYRLGIIRWGDGPDKPDGDPLLIGVDGAKSLRALLAKRLGTVTIATLDKHHIVDFEDIRWSLTRTPHVKHDGTPAFPSWWNLIPDTDPYATVKVDRDDMLAASRAASAITPKNAPLRITTTGFDAVVRTLSPDKGGMTRRLATAEITGRDIECGFNPEFLADICAAAPVERLTVKLIAPLRPAVIEAARDQYVLMPIRLNV